MTASGKKENKICLACGYQTNEDEAICPNDRTPLTGGDPLLGKIFLNKYEIVEVLGTGGMGAVYKARHLLMDRFVAIKLLRTETGTDTNTLRRFQLESKAVSKLNHPNVLGVHDFGLTPDAVPYLVMDFLEGKTIDIILDDEGQLAPDRCVNIFAQVCGALGHAHSKNVIHRDVKPSNIIVSVDEAGNEFPRIVDFGIAKVLTAEVGDMALTRTGEVFGSPLYMAPEQCKAGSMDARTDVYALGTVLYECLTGVPAIVGETPMDTMVRHLTDMPVSFKEARPDLRIPEALEAVVFKSLAKDREDRYQTMEEFGAALRASLSGVSSQSSQTNQAGLPSAMRSAPAAAGIEAAEETAPIDAVAEDLSRTRPSSLSGSGIASGIAPGAAPSVNPAQSRSGPVEPPVPNFGALEKTGTAGKQSGSDDDDDFDDLKGDARGGRAPQVVASYDLFGNAIMMPAAPDRVKDTGGMFSGDRGNALESLANSSGSSASSAAQPAYKAADDDDDEDVPLAPSEIFGSAALLPAVADKGGGLPSLDTASSGGDRGPVPFLERPGSFANPNQNLPDKKKLIIGAAAGIAALLAVGAFMSRDQIASMLGGPSTTKTIAPSIVNLTPPEVFKRSTPALVMLTITNAALQVSCDPFEVTNKEGEPILAVPVGDRGLCLMAGGEPVNEVSGYLVTRKGKIPVTVKLRSETPVLQITDPKTGEKMTLSAKGIGLTGYKVSGIGSGFFVEPNVVATNYHVVSPTDTGKGGFYKGQASVGDKINTHFEIQEKPIVLDKDHDLALLYVPGTGAPVLKMRTDLSGLQVGEPVYALGSPKGLDRSMSNGEISADKLRWSNPRSETGIKLYLQHSAKIDHGNSGGPLVDSRGEVIGVNTAYMGNGSINLAVVSKFIRELLDRPEVRARIDELNKGTETDLKG